MIKNFWPSSEAFLTSHDSSMNTFFLDFLLAKNVCFPMFCECSPEENESSMYTRNYDKFLVNSVKLFKEGQYHFHKIFTQINRFLNIYTLS